MRSRPRDAGSATVEFALVAPFVLLLVAAAAGVLAALASAVALADAAGVMARAAGRGDAGAVDAAAARLPPGTRVEVAGGDPVCVRLSRTASLPGLGGVLPLHARSCAPGGGA